MAWFLGWAITDGCVQLTINGKRNSRHVASIMLKDREPLEIMQRLFQTTKPIEECWRKRDDKWVLYYRLRLCGKVFTEQLVKYGVLPNKTFTTRMPEVPKEYMWHFLRGVMEGDGTIFTTTGGKYNSKEYRVLRVEICSGNESFLKDIQGILGSGYLYYNDKEGHSRYNLVLDCSNAVKFCKNAYIDSDNIRLTRKYDKWLTFLATGKEYSPNKGLYGKV